MAYRLKDHQARIDRLEQRLLAEISRDKYETAAELSARLGAEYSFVCAALKQVRSRDLGATQGVASHGFVSCTDATRQSRIAWIVVPSVGKGRPKLAYKLK